MANPPHLRLFKEARTEAVGKELDKNGTLPFFMHRLGRPGMWKIGSKEAKITSLKIFHRVANKSQSFSLLIQIDLDFRVVMPRKRQAPLIHMKDVE